MDRRCRGVALRPRNSPGPRSRGSRRPRSVPAAGGARRHVITEQREQYRRCERLSEGEEMQDTVTGRVGT